MHTNITSSLFYIRDNKHIAYEYLVCFWICDIFVVKLENNYFKLQDAFFHSFHTLWGFPIFSLFFFSPSLSFLAFHGISLTVQNIEITVYILLVKYTININLYSIRDTFTELVCIISGSHYFKCPSLCFSLLDILNESPCFLSATSLNFLLILKIKEMRCKCQLRISICWQFAFKPHMELETSIHVQCCHLLLNTLHPWKDLFYFWSQYQLEQMSSLIRI